ncbi:hypothetical protein HON22_02375 [Candidatus Peregrinibacteria bacterium]|jgi:hypothetical protein|nr:hypothetical protein [Candidatus Peregrinibacteria bacterium]
MGFRRVLDDGTLGEVVTTTEAERKKDLEELDRLNEQLRTGEKTIEEIRQETSWFYGIARKDIIIHEPGRAPYSAKGVTDGIINSRNNER